MFVLLDFFSSNFMENNLINWNRFDVFFFARKRCPRFNLGFRENFYFDENAFRGWKILKFHLGDQFVGNLVLDLKLIDCQSVENFN